MCVQGAVRAASRSEEEGEFWKVLLDVPCQQRTWEGWVFIFPVGRVRRRRESNRQQGLSQVLCKSRRSVSGRVGWDI